MSYKNYNWKVWVKDVNSPFIRNLIWTRPFIDYPKLLNLPKLNAGILTIKDQSYYVVDYKSLEKCHNALVEKVKKNVNFLNELIDETNKFGESFNKWSEKNIFLKDLTILNNKEIIELYKKFMYKQSFLYALGVAIPILDIEDYKYVESNVENILNKKVSDNFQKYFTIFTYPNFDSFSLEQEKDLLWIILKYDSNDWRKDIKNLNLKKLKKKYSNFYLDLTKHKKKYAWVYYVYSGPAYNEEDFINLIINILDDEISPEEKLDKLIGKRIRANKQKILFEKDLNPNIFQKEILNLSGKIVWAKPRRKDYQSKSYYHFEKLQKEISRRTNLSLKQVRSLTVEDIIEALNGIDKKDIANEIIKSHAVLPNEDGSITILIGDEAKTFIENIVGEKKNELNLDHLKGRCAYNGIIEGIAKIVNKPSDMHKINKNEILVSVATTPSIIMAMKKASAFVTDEGGLTCHAAIVSREMCKPCVVGTKHATKIIKDGDLIRVDANNGVVKILKRFKK